MNACGKRRRMTTLSERARERERVRERETDRQTEEKKK